MGPVPGSREALFRSTKGTRGFMRNSYSEQLHIAACTRISLPTESTQIMHLCDLFIHFVYCVTVKEKNEIWGFELSYDAVSERVIRSWVLILLDVGTRETKLDSCCIYMLTLSDS